MEMFVSTLPAAGQTPEGRKEQWEDRLLSCADESLDSQSQIMVSWAHECDKLLERFGGPQRVLQDIPSVVETVFEEGAYIVLRDELEADEVEDIMAAVCDCANANNLMFYNPLHMTSSLP